MLGEIVRREPAKPRDLGAGRHSRLATDDAACKDETEARLGPSKVVERNEVVELDREGGPFGDLADGSLGGSLAGLNGSPVVPQRRRP